MPLFQWWGGAVAEVEEVAVIPVSDPCAVCGHVHEETVVDPTDMHRRITYALRCGECGCVANGRAYAGVAA